MNKLITDFPNGFALEADDIRFEQKAVRDMFTAVFSPLAEEAGGRGFIISGCQKYSQVQGQLVEPRISDGWVFLDGEILKFRDKSDSALYLEGNSEWFELQVSYDSAGDELDYQGDNIQSYEVREVILNIGDTELKPEGSFNLNGWRYEQLIAKIVDNQEVYYIAQTTGDLTYSNLEGEVEINYFEFPDNVKQNNLTARISGEFTLNDLNATLKIAPTADSTYWRPHNFKVETINGYKHFEAILKLPNGVNLEKVYVKAEVIGGASGATATLRRMTFEVK